MGLLDKYDAIITQREGEEEEKKQPAASGLLAAYDRIQAGQTPTPASAPSYDALQLPTPQQWAERPSSRIKTATDWSTALPAAKGAETKTYTPLIQRIQTMEPTQTQASAEPVKTGVGKAEPGSPGGVGRGTSGAAQTKELTAGKPAIQPPEKETSDFSHKSGKLDDTSRIDYGALRRGAAREAAAFTPTSDMYLSPVTAATAGQMQTVADRAAEEAKNHAEKEKENRSALELQREKTAAAYAEARAMQPTSDMYLHPATAQTANDMQEQQKAAAARAEEENKKLHEMGGRYGLKEDLLTVGENLAAGGANAVRGIANALSYAGQEMTKGQLMEQQSVMSGLPGQQEIADSSTKTLQEVKDRGLQSVEETYDTLGIKAVGKAGRAIQDFSQKAAQHAQASGKVAQALAQTANGVGGMVPSILANVAAPGSALWVMAAQAAGNATEEALAAGAQDEKAVLYGGAVAAVEVLTEKLFGGIPGLNVGSLDDAVEDLVKEHIGGEAAQRAILFLADAIGEGAEEFISEFADWSLNKRLVGDDKRTLREVRKDAWYSAMIGALTSVAMQGSAQALKRLGPKELARRVAEEMGERLETEAAQETSAQKIAEAKYQAMKLPTAEQTKNAAPEGTADLTLPEVKAAADVKAAQKGEELALPTAEEWANRSEKADPEETAGNLELPDPAKVAGNGNAAQEGADTQPIKVGQATTINNPYEGPTPEQTAAPGSGISVSDESVDRAQSFINQALQGATIGESKFKATLKKLYRSVFQRSSAVPVTGLTFDGEPYYVEIGSKVPGKVISDKNLSREKLALLDSLEDVVKNGQYVGSGKAIKKEGKQSFVRRYDYFETEATIGGKPYIVKFDVEVLPDVNNYRTHQIVNVDLSALGDGLVGPEPTAAPNGTSPHDVVRNMVQHNSGDVNTSYPAAGENMQSKTGLELPAVPTQAQTAAQQPQDLSLPSPEEAAKGTAAQQMEVKPLPTAEEWRDRDVTAAQPEEEQADPGRLPTAEEWKNRGTEAQLAETETGEPMQAVPETQEAPERPAGPEEMSDGGRSVNGYAASPGLRKLGVKIAEPITDTIGADVLVAQAQKAEAAETALNKAIKKLAPTKAEKALAQGLADGTFTEGNGVLYGKDGAPIRDVNMNKVRELAEYYRQKNQYKRDRIAEQHRVNRDNETAIAEDLLKTADGFKEMSALRLNLNTMKRNMLAWAGQTLGAKINQHLFDPVTQNSAERIRFVDRMLDRVREFHLTKAESEMVQRVIEGTAVQDQVSKLTEDARRRVNAAAESNDFGLTAAEYNLTADEKQLAQRYHDWLQTKAQLQDMDAEKINAAAKAYSDAYSDFYTAINEFLVMHGYEPIGFIQGYAPHLQPDNVQSTLGKVMSIFGLDAEVSALPTDIAGQTENYKPGKQWNPYFQHRAGADSMIDAVAGYESYVNYLSNVLYHTDDIQKLRVFIRTLQGMYASEEIREKLDQAKWIKGRSAEEKADFLRINKMIGEGTQLTPEMANDLIDKYVDGLYDSIENMTKHGDVASVLEDYTNKLAGKQTKLDRAIESLFGRRKINFGNALSRIFGESAVVGNLSSALNQLSQLPAVLAEVGNKYVLQAIGDIIRGNTAVMDQESDFLTGKLGTDSLLAERSWKDSDSKQRHAKVTNAMSIPFEAVDMLASRLYVRAKYLQEIENGATHEAAMKAADNFAEQVVGNRIQGSRPMVFESKNAIVKLFSTFQLEVANAWAHISQDLPAEIMEIAETKGKSAAVKRIAEILTRYTVSAFLLNRLAETLYGGTPAPFDVFGYIVGGLAAGSGLTVNQYLMQAVANALGLGDGDDDEDDKKEFDVGAALKETGSLMVGDMPYVRNAASILGYGDSNLPLPQLGGTLKEAGNLMSGKGSAEAFGKAAIKDAATWIPGGNQMKKTAQGLDTLIRGGRYDKNGNLMYPVDFSGAAGLAKAAKAGFFGRSSLGATDAYYATGDRTLTAAQTAAYEKLVKIGEDKQTVYDTIQAIRKVKDVTGTDEDAREKRDILREVDMRDYSKAELYAAMFGSGEDDREKQYEKIAGMLDRGLSFDECMDVVDMHKELSESDEKASMKASRFAQWVDSVFEPDAAEYIKENYKYWQNIPAEANAYDKATAAGVDIDTAADAMKINNAAKGKKDADGETISGTKKAEVIRGVDTLNISEEDKLRLLESMDYKVDGYDQVKALVSLTEYAEALEAKALAKGKKDSKGDTIDGTKEADTIRGVDMLKISDSAKLALLESMDYKAEGYDKVRSWMTLTEYADAMDLKATAKGKQDDKGNIVDGSKQLEVMRGVERMNLTPKQKTQVMEALGYDMQKEDAAPPMWDTKYDGKDYEAYYYMSASQRETYGKYCDWMPVSEYSRYSDSIKDFHSEKDENGKTTVSRQSQVIAYIDALDLTPDQKTALYVASGYNENLTDKGFKDCPWWNRLALRSKYYPTK